MYGKYSIASLQIPLTGDIACMHKQCVPDLSSGWGGGLEMSLNWMLIVGKP